MDHTPKIDPRPTIRANIGACGLDPELVERWLSKTEFDPETGCLNWTDKPTADGYGNMWWKGRKIYAHHTGCALRHGPGQAGQIVLHSCKENRRCVNPDHLRYGTHAENRADAFADGTANNGQRLTDEDITVITGYHLLGHSATSIRKATGAGLTTIRSVKKGKQRPDAVSDELDRVTGAVNNPGEKSTDLSSATEG